MRRHACSRCRRMAWAGPCTVLVMAGGLTAHHAPRRHRYPGDAWLRSPRNRLPVVLPTVQWDKPHLVRLYDLEVTCCAACFHPRCAHTYACACDWHGCTHVPVHGDVHNADACDTQADPLEEHNIALANQAVVERMAARARELMADAPPQAGAVHAVFRYLMAFLLLSSTALVALVSLLGWCVVRRCRRSWAPFVAPGSSSRSATHGSRGRDNVNSHEHFD